MILAGGALSKGTSLEFPKDRVVAVLNAQPVQEPLSGPPTRSMTQMTGDLCQARSATRKRR